MTQLIASVYQIGQEDEDPAEDKGCFTEVVDECEDVCDVCRDVGPKAVEEVRLFYSVFRKSIRRQRESCTDFNNKKSDIGRF